MEERNVGSTAETLASAIAIHTETFHAWGFLLPSSFHNATNRLVTASILSVGIN